MSSIGIKGDERGVTRAVVAQGASGSDVLISGVAGMRHKITGGMLTLSADGSIKFTSGGADLCGPMDIAARSGFVIDADMFDPLFISAPGQDLTLVTTGGAARGILKILTEAA